MVLVGKVNRDIVGAINTHGPLAVGLSGEDAGLITSVARDPALGFVGDVESVNPAILHRLLAEDLIPVVSTIGGSAEGQAYNINADTVAGALAAALEAEKVIYLTDVPGLLADVDDPDSLIRTATATELRDKIDRRRAHRRDDPQDRSRRLRRRARRARRPPRSTDGSSTSCCSSCSPTRASAR